MASKSRGVGHASSIFHQEHGVSTSCSTFYRQGKAVPPIPSVNWALLPHFFTLILLIHAPLPPSPYKGFLLHFHQCCPLSTPSCLKAMADAAKLIISKVTQDKAAEFPPTLSMHLYSCWCHLQILYEVSSSHHITSSTETKSLSWREGLAVHASA